jgi:UDP-N-acetylglucosamine transferase subunit ALG13
MKRFVDKSRVIVTHAAAGAVIMALKNEIPTVIVPRLRKYGEHFDDHQFELASALSGLGRVILVDEPNPDSLLIATKQANALLNPAEGPSVLVKSLSKLLLSWENNLENSERFFEKTNN